MDRVALLHRRIAPELISVIEERYNILRHIQYSQPIGRRALAGMLAIGERIIRAQVDFLKTAGLVDFTPLGMMVTKNDFLGKDEIEIRGQGNTCHYW